MGLIAKQLRKKGNERFTEIMRTTTSLSLDEVVDEVENLIAAYNAEASAKIEQNRNGGVFGKLKNFGVIESDQHFYIRIEPGQITVTYEKPVDWLGEHAKKRPGSTSGYWLAAITFPNEPAPPAGQQNVAIKLLLWVINDDGEIKNRDKYETFTELLWEALH